MRRRPHLPPHALSLSARRRTRPPSRRGSARGGTADAASGSSRAELAELPTAAQATATTLFFFDSDGNQVGSILHPRPQGPTENCTWHNLNVVPTDKGYVLVSGNYQSGISVVDFSDPANAHEIAFADPAPLVNPDNPAAIELGGDWSTYWYNGRIYESDITRGLIIWKLSDPAVAGAEKLPHLNPQTQEFTIDLK